MGTFLFNETIFGPVISRRLGVSLGINLLPNNGKICSFDCVYCECGLNKEGKVTKPKLPTREAVVDQLEAKLLEMKKNHQLPDVITFAGNGEPTIHPQFSEIIDDTICLRNKYAPDSGISVLSNALHLTKPKVAEALLKVDQNILKLDSAVQETFDLINRPQNITSVENIIDNLAAFKGDIILQTLFCSGTINNKAFDNASAMEIEHYLNALNKIRPKSVMIYSFSRDTPFDTLEQTNNAVLQKIAKKVESLGLKAEVTG